MTGARTVLVASAIMFLLFALLAAPVTATQHYASDGTQVQQQTDGSQGLGERGQQWERIFLIIAIVGFFTLIALLLYLVLKLR